MDCSTIFLLFFACTIVNAASLKNNYAHFLSMDEEENYLMYWTTNDIEQTMDFAISVKTSGWVGFGFSPYTGRMPGSDTIIGWVANGKAYLQDRFAESHSTPTLDASQDYTLISGEESNGITTLKFKRKYNTADNKDLPLESGTSRLIWSYHSSDPESGNKFTKHVKQGSRSVNLFDTIPEVDKPPLPNDTKSFVIANKNIRVPAKDTTYWCSSFKLPEITGSAHIIKISPYIQKRNEGLVRHILIYDCVIHDSLKDKSQDCDSQNVPLALRGCRGATALAAWAVGGKDITLPAHVGVPIGGSSGVRYVLMEIHYDNPNKTPGLQDSSGLKFYYTLQKRPYDAAVLEIGRLVSSQTTSIIPERQTKWEVAGYCSQNCTNLNLPAGGINVFSGMMHTHLAGRSIIVKQFRNGSELAPLISNPHYDFNFQEFVYLKKAKKILPGDQLTVVCTYNTENRANYTVGGLAANDEMCLAYLYYYPKQDIAVCLSYQPEHIYQKFLERLNSANQTPKTLGSNFTKELITLENTVIPLQYCAGRSHRLLQAAFHMEIPDLIRVKTNINEISGTTAISYSSWLSNISDVDNMRLLIALVLAITCSIAKAATLESSYAHFVSLDEDGKYFMYWTTNDITKMIHIAISVKTTGWVGFGISPYTGRMPGSDTVIGWVSSNGTAYLQDRYATGYSTPALDQSQDYNLVSGEETNGMTILKFTRKYNTTDSKDLPLEGGTTRLIWSYHSSDPVSPTIITKHQKQGTRSVNLFHTIPEADKPSMPNDTQSFTIINTNVSIPANKDTTYWCSAFRVPEINGSAHIIKLAPHIEKGNEGLVHHILIYECIMDENHVGQSHDCASRNMPLGLRYCRGATAITAWAVGGKEIFFPAHVGLPIGKGSGVKYLLMEVHYDNPKLEAGRFDSSGMKFFYTFHKRQYDAGVMQIGKVVSRRTIIPERQKKWEVAGYCAKSCTQANIPATGINIFSGLLHTHLAGRAITLKQFRNGNEITPLANNPHYDFNYQEFVYFKNPKKILPGDQVTIVCSYNTENRPNYTRGGIGTKDEMCLSYLYYWPKLTMAVCESYESTDHYENFMTAIQERKTLNTKLVKDLISLQNNAPPMQYCAAKNHAILQPTRYMAISDFKRVKVNFDWTGGAQHITYSNLFVVLIALLAYSFVDGTHH
ncbi:DBH-like monooxygenase protein 1-like protein [Trichoplax sp. H2]|nr:DBH-like monooxygenase protein 1-like protein [Trichoplax sp. H2]|eukprot:RDD43175.1 DBH-like monooxygenase protein 1-like protein [Trichoplax sp. H2]